VRAAITAAAVTGTPAVGEALDCTFSACAFMIDYFQERPTPVGSRPPARRPRGRGHDR
jgi:hypothetical protein